MVNLSVLDEANHYIIMAAQHGLPAREITPRWFPAGESMTYKAIMSNSPISYADIFAQSDFPKAHQTATQWGYRSVLCIPFPLDTPRCSAVIMHRDRHNFTHEEVARARATVTTAAIAIRNAFQFEQQLSETLRLIRKNEEIDRERRRLDEANALRTNLTELLLRDGNLDQLTSAVAVAVGHDVLVEDAWLNFMAFAAANGQTGGEARLALGLSLQQLQPQQHCADLLERVRQERRALYAPDEALGCGGRLVAPILGGPHVLAYLSVLNVPPPPSPEMVARLEACVGLIALYVTQDAKLNEVEIRARTTAFEAFVARPEPDALVRFGTRLGFDFRRGFAPLLIASSNAALTEVVPVVTVTRTLEVLLRELCDQSMVLPRGDALLVLASAKSDRTSQYPAALAELLADGLRRAGADPIVAIGPRCADWKDLPRALAETGRTLLAQRRLGGTPSVGTFDQLGVVAMLLEGTSDGDLNSFCERLLGPLEEHDRTRDGDLVLSLRVYLDHNCSMRRSARELFVHVNTLRHRLDQIRRLIGLDLDDPDVRIRLQLALRLRAATS
jgi:hypothetical protein